MKKNMILLDLELLKEYGCLIHIKARKDYLRVGWNLSTDLQFMVVSFFPSLFYSGSCMKAQEKQYSEGVACFGQMTTGMSTPTFLISLPTSHRCLTSFTQSFSISDLFLWNRDMVESWYVITQQQCQLSINDWN